jgi:hypothetical protein
VSRLEYYDRHAISCDVHDCTERFVGGEDALWCEVIGDAMTAGWDLWAAEYRAPDLCPDHYGTSNP